VVGELQGLLGFVRQEQGRVDEAIAALRQAVVANPRQYDALTRLAQLLVTAGKVGEAVDIFRQAVALRPAQAGAHSNLANALHLHGQAEEAMAEYRRAIELDPRFVGAHVNLGLALSQVGRPDEALPILERALELQPNNAEAWNNLGGVYSALGRTRDCEQAFRRALELRPDYPEAWNNLGNALHSQLRLDEAASCFSRAIELRPNYPEAHSNSGNVLFAMGRREAAAAAYRRAVELRPSYGDAWHNFGLLHQHAGKVGEAIDCYRQALKFKPEEAGIACELAHQLQHECRWGDELMRLEKQVVAAVEADELDSLTTPIPPFAFICLPTPASPQLHLRCARQWAARLSREHGPANAAMARGPKFAGPTRAEDRKLVIGYLSADFHSHATAWLAAELFESHDRKQFSIHAYSYGPDETSAMRQRLVAAFDRFVDVREMSFDGAARAIEADGVDILVDLKGYTRDSRSEILARRPAPIQVNYLGYPGTMGADFIDYALVDEIIAPAAEQACYSERLVQLPGCYQVNDSRREVSSRPWTRQECGLPAEGVVLCCFNNSFKITPEL
ncbi:MAG TPA: tetratricopeptide repeat protein, partial [Pirellulaceae bacterium]|nr:tetratricopeptide repeat protein [Pirellulaceae bacterium]